MQQRTSWPPLRRGRQNGDSSNQPGGRARSDKPLPSHHVQLDGASGFVQRRGVAYLRQDRPPANLVPQPLCVAWGKLGISDLKHLMPRTTHGPEQPSWAERLQHASQWSAIASRMVMLQICFHATDREDSKDGCNPCTACVQHLFRLREASHYRSASVASRVISMEHKRACSFFRDRFSSPMSFSRRFASCRSKQALSDGSIRIARPGHWYGCQSQPLLVELRMSDQTLASEIAMVYHNQDVACTLLVWWEYCGVEY